MPQKLDLAVALPGKDKSTFIPLDNKKFEDIVNPPILRKDPSRISKTDEAAILKLIEDYENALIKAINAPGVCWLIRLPVFMREFRG